MAEVDHWMWRLFLDDLGDACASVGLQNVPFLKDTQVLLPSPTPLLYGISPSLLRQQAFWPDRFVTLSLTVYLSFVIVVSVCVAVGK